MWFDVKAQSGIHKIKPDGRGGVLKSHISLALWANMNFDALLCSYLLLWLGWSQLLNHHYLPSMTMYYLISRHFDEWWFYFWPQMHNIIRLVSDIRVNYHLCIIDAPQIKCDFFFKIAKSKFFQALIKLWHSCSSFASVIILILEGLFISHNIPIGILRCNKNIGT